MSDKDVEWSLGWTGQKTAEQWPCRLVLHMDFFFPHVTSQVFTLN